MSKRGQLVVIEGIDGSGKDTQAKLLGKNLEKLGKKVYLTAFPRYNKESSVLIREYLAGNFGAADEVGPYRASVFYAIDRYAESFKINEYLNKGYYVIADRYVSSNKGHQAQKIKSKKERIEYLNWLNDFEYNIMGIPVPDVTIYLAVKAEVSDKLIKSRVGKEGIKKDIHENLAHLKLAERSYKEMIRMDKSENWITVKCSNRGQMRTIRDIQADVLAVVNNIGALGEIHR